MIMVNNDDTNNNNNNVRSPLDPQGSSGPFHVASDESPGPHLCSALELGSFQLGRLALEFSARQAGRREPLRRLLHHHYYLYSTITVTIIMYMTVTVTFTVTITICLYYYYHYYYHYYYYIARGAGKGSGHHAGGGGVESGHPPIY